MHDELASNASRTPGNGPKRPVRDRRRVGVGINVASRGCVLGSGRDAGNAGASAKPERGTPIRPVQPGNLETINVEKLNSSTVRDTPSPDSAFTMKSIDGQDIFPAPQNERGIGEQLRQHRERTRMRELPPIVD